MVFIATERQACRARLPLLCHALRPLKLLVRSLWEVMVDREPESMLKS